MAGRKKRRDCNHSNPACELCVKKRAAAAAQLVRDRTRVAQAGEQDDWQGQRYQPQAAW